MSTQIVQEKKSWGELFIDRAKREMANASPASPATYIRAVGSVAVEYAEGAATGALLGATHAKFGLDSPIGPVDGWIAALGAASSIAISGVFPEAAVHARTIGAQAFTVFAFRRSSELVSHQALPGGRVVGGVQRVALSGKGPGIAREDPIEVVARGLG